MAACSNFGAWADYGFEGTALAVDRENEKAALLPRPEKHRGNVKAAPESLGLSKTTFTGE
ncbi:MAG TPA: hypothetical protein VF173_21915 [Thermoanaerobaculia bacterium]|nr:hypothetical protein [Thermoanaerobaculia bacterium]